jgi:hypothetical protein
LRQHDVKVILQNQFLILSFVALLGFSFTLSQVSIILTTYASLVSEVLKNVNAEVRVCHWNFQGAIKAGSWVELEEQLASWQSRTAHARRLCEILNEYFNLIRFGCYGLDFLTLLGFGAHLLGPLSSIQHDAFNILSLLFFASYITIFLSSLISTQEQVLFLHF